MEYLLTSKYLLNNFDYAVNEGIISAEKAIDGVLSRSGFSADHRFKKTLGNKSQIGTFGEVFFMALTDSLERDNTEHDCIHPLLGKVEIKTSKLKGDKNLTFNQIYFEKDWESLVFIAVHPSIIEVFYAINNEELKAALITNNGGCFSGKPKALDELIPFTKILSQKY